MLPSRRSEVQRLRPSCFQGKEKLQRERHLLVAPQGDLAIGAPISLIHIIRNPLRVFLYPSAFPTPRNTRTFSPTDSCKAYPVFPYILLLCIPLIAPPLFYQVQTLHSQVVLAYHVLPVGPRRRTIGFSLGSPGAPCC